MIIIIWIVYACLEGIREAYYYHLNCISDKPIEKNLHPLFTVQRAVVLLILLFPFHIDKHFFVLISACACVFPCAHNSTYYYMRNKLNPLIYPKKWFAQSTTSTAFSTKFFTPVVRTMLAVVGVLGLILIK